MPPRLTSITSLIKRPVTALLLAQGLTALVAFVVNIAATNSLTTTGRGSLAFWLQIGYISTTFALLGIERPFAASRQGTFGQTLNELSIVGRHHWYAVGGLGIASLTALAVSPANAPMLAITAAFVVGNIRMRWIRTAYIASGETRRYFTAVVTHQLLVLTGALVLFLLGIDKAFSWYAAYTIAAASGIVWAIQANATRASPSPDIAPSMIKSIRGQGLRLIPASFGNTAMLRFDRLAMPVLASSAELGIYVAVATVMEIAHWPTQQWADSSLRRFSIAHREGATIALTRLYSRVIVGSGIVASTMGLVAYLSVTNLMPSSYQASLALIPPLGFAAVIYAVSRLQQALLIARGKASSVSVVELCGMACSIALYLGLIPQMGAMGAAVGSLGGYITATAIGAWFVCSSDSQRGE